MKNSLFFALLTAATTTTSTVFGLPARIVGGDKAKPGDFPYFVEMGGCGGALVAPDIVLFAAHCAEFTDFQLSIGAYKKESLAEGAQERFCEEWTPDPKYGTGGRDINYDFALCKLNEPVFIDSKIKLEINEDDSFPKVNDNLVVMGLGATKEGGDSANVLEDVTVPAMSNQKCNKSKFYGGLITDIMLCAGFPKGKKDSCQGDSGGPLVKRKVNNDGTITDTHVGVVSWGEGCARKNKPGVYARTSKRSQWIKDTSCNMGSIADFCNNNPVTPGPCDQDLTINLTTDKYAYETSWTLKDSKNKKVMTRKYLINFYDNTHTICLKANECYEWTLSDDYNDGMCAEKCGSYTFDLNGSEILSGNGKFKGKRTERFCTGGGGSNPVSPPNEDQTSAPSSTSSTSSTVTSTVSSTTSTTQFCNDDATFKFKGNNNKTCADWVAKGNRKKIRKKCKMKSNGLKVMFWCPKTCGQEGLGFCDFLE
jgi:trypsin